MSSVVENCIVKNLLNIYHFCYCVNNRRTLLTNCILINRYFHQHSQFVFSNIWITCQDSCFFEKRLGDAAYKEKRTRIRSNFMHKTLRTSLLCCQPLWTLSSTRQQSMKTTQPRSVWSLMLRTAKCWRSLLRVKPAWMSETETLRGLTVPRTWAPMSPRTAEAEPISGRG